MTDRELHLLWAKLGQDTDAYPTQAHPVLHHLFDVQHVATELWNQSLGQGFRQWLADEVGMLPEDTARWIPVWVAAHDLGKMSPEFQVKAASQNRHLIPTLKSAGFNCDFPVRSQSIPHGQVTAVTLPGILTAAFGVPPSLARSIAQASGGHHGRFLTTQQHTSLGQLLRANSRQIGTGIWTEARRQAIQRLAENVGVARRDDWPHESVSSAWLMALAGLTTVADWIASMSEFFPPAGIETELSDYLPRSRQRAAIAVEQLGWTGWNAPPSGLPLEELFPVIRRYGARPLQSLVEELKPGLSKPSLVLVEAPMGEGKTEAAMALADHWAATCQQRGCYFALPTMATSNQMFGRVREFLEHRYGGRSQQVNLLLLHGRASLSEALRELLDAASPLQPTSLADDDVSTLSQDTRSNAGVVASEWFTYRKRGLLAPFGVGTIDQALMAVLRTKHVFVRLFGLAHKTIIIDEVHAYDAYMNELLVLLLRWLRKLGASVVLLSATLPQSTRRHLLAEYADLDPDDVDWAGSSQASYPRLSWVIDDTIQARSFAAASRVTLRLVRHPDDVSQWGSALSDALSDGGCAAVICNTVAHAQNTYRALRNWFRDEELDLFHARFPFGDREAREAREARTLQQFGPTNTPTLRPRRVLVATQVIEQSLDLDFDLMLTQVAPVDLILQRAGRLHRHAKVGDTARERPAGFEQPTLWLLQPLPNEDETPDFRASRFVYDPHVLLKSWLIFSRRMPVSTASHTDGVLIGDSITMPDQIEPLIESVYSDDDCPDDLPLAIRRMWEKTRAASESETDTSANAARQKLISPPQDLHEGSVSNIVDPAWLMDEDSPDINKAFQALTRRQTRPSVSIVCLFTSPEGLRLQPDGPLVDTDTPPDHAAIEQFIRQSVSISKWAVTTALRESPQVPTAWQKVALLRSLHVVEFDGDSREAVVGGQTLILHPELGIVFPEQLDEEL